MIRSGQSGARCRVQNALKREDNHNLREFTLLGWPLRLIYADAHAYIQGETLAYGAPIDGKEAV